MGNSIKITLPLPPSSNTAYKKTKYNRRLYLSKEAAQWKEDTLWLLKKFNPVEPPVDIAFKLYFPDKRRRDHWNYTKLAVDCLVESGIIKDDNWIINPSASLQADLSEDNPRVEIVVTSLK